MKEKRCALRGFMIFLLISLFAWAVWATDTEMGFPADGNEQNRATQSDTLAISCWFSYTLESVDPVANTFTLTFEGIAWTYPERVEVTDWHWSFADGTEASGRTVTRTFSGLGEVSRVTLTASVDAVSDTYRGVVWGIGGINKVLNDALVRADATHLQRLQATLGWRRGSVEKIYRAVVDLSLEIFSLAERHGLMSLSQLPQALGEVAKSLLPVENSGGLQLYGLLRANSPMAPLEKITAVLTDSLGGLPGLQRFFDYTPQPVGRQHGRLITSITLPEVYQEVENLMGFTTNLLAKLAPVVNDHTFELQIPTCVGCIPDLYMSLDNGEIAGMLAYLAFRKTGLKALLAYTPGDLFMANLEFRFFDDGTMEMHGWDVVERTLQANFHVAGENGILDLDGSGDGDAVMGHELFPADFLTLRDGRWLQSARTNLVQAAAWLRIAIQDMPHSPGPHDPQIEWPLPIFWPWTGERVWVTRVDALNLIDTIEAGLQGPTTIDIDINFDGVIDYSTVINLAVLANNPIADLKSLLPDLVVTTDHTDPLIVLYDPVGDGRSWKIDGTLDWNGMRVMIGWPDPALGGVLPNAGANDLLALLLFGQVNQFDAFVDHFAVIVGVADYPGTILDLMYTTNDAIALYASLLEDAARWSSDRMHLLLNEQATKTAILAAISEIAAQGDANDVFLFFFSGHGTTGVDLIPLDENDGLDEYLCSYGTVLSDFIRDDELAQWLSFLPMEQIIVLLDTCFSGGQIRAIMDDRRVKSINPGVSPARNDGFAADIRMLGQRAIGPQDLDELDKQIVVLTSSDDYQLSWEFGSPISHGLFTYYLLHALTGFADQEGNLDGDMTAEEVYAYLFPRVVAMSNFHGLHQRPQLLDLAVQSLVLRSWARCPGALPIPPPPPPLHTKSYTYGTVAGWYMISVPLAGVAADLFGTTAWLWNAAAGEYIRATVIEPGKGYWVNIPANKQISIAGDPIVSDVTLNVTTAGWHMISAPWIYPKAKIEVVQGAVTKTWAEAVTAGWVRANIYGFTAVVGAFTTPITMNPWYGYWMRAEVSGLSLRLRHAAGTPVAAAEFGPLAIAAANAPTVVAPFDLPAMPPTVGISAENLVFGNFPNPVVDINTTTFAVKGAAAHLVEELKVQIFDLSGELVYEAQVFGNRHDWHTDDNHGELLANGVYLYKLSVLINGQWRVSEVMKVVILRQ